MLPLRTTSFTYGEIEDGYFESSFEEGERWNKIYSDAYEWVKSKYEWLSS